MDRKEVVDIANGIANFLKSRKIKFMSFSDYSQEEKKEWGKLRESCIYNKNGICKYNCTGVKTINLKCPNPYEICYYPKLGIYGHYCDRKEILTGGNVILMIMFERICEEFIQLERTWRNE